MNKFLNKDVFIIILCVIITLLFLKWRQNVDKVNEKENLVESLSANLETWKDRDSLNRARIQVIETARTKDFLAIKSNDSIVMELQRTVKKFRKELKKQGSVTILKTNTQVETSSETQVVAKDTVNNNGTQFIYPEYKSQFNLNNWVVGNTVANKDSTAISLSVINEYSLVIGQESQGLFKKSKPFADVKNLNPYTETEVLRTYQVTLPKPPRLNLGGYIGYGATVSNNQVLIGPQAGVGLNIKIF